MIILVTLGSLLALAGGLGVLIARRDRRSQIGPGDRIDAPSPDTMGVRQVGEYFPPPDDGRPQH